MMVICMSCFILCFTIVVPCTVSGFILSGSKLKCDPQSNIHVAHKRHIGCSEHKCTPLVLVMAYLEMCATFLPVTDP